MSLTAGIGQWWRLTMSECQVCHCEDAIPSCVLEFCDDCYDRDENAESQACGKSGLLRMTGRLTMSEIERLRELVDAGKEDRKAIDELVAEHLRLREIADEVENLHCGTDLFTSCAAGTAVRLIELIEMGGR